MAIDDNENAEEVEDKANFRSLLAEDIHDSPEDADKLKSEVFSIDLPDVSDIPGQENIVVPRIGEMQDTTISSDDEEGVGIFGDDEADEDTDLIEGNDADVTAVEKDLLQKATNDTYNGDDALLRRAELDKTDNEGEILNEGSPGTNISGSDLDSGGLEEDDELERIGEEDEENNDYSTGGDDNDDVTAGTV